MIRGWYSTVSWVRLLNHSVAMASSGSSGSAISYCSSAMPAAFAARSSTSRLYESATSSSMHQCSTLPSNHGCSTSSRCSPQTLQFSLDQHIPPCGPLSSPNHSSKRDKQRSRGLSSSSTCGHGLQQPALLQPSRCTWPAFASLTANSQLGQLRWRHSGTQSADSSSSRREGGEPEPQQKQQQGPEGSSQGSGLTAEQIQRDMQRLADDVFQPGQVLAGGRYQLLRKIAPSWGLAEGRFTTVWHGKDLSNNSDVILKCMEAGDGTSYIAGMREAALHATAGRCPNIVSLLDAFEHRSSSGRHPVMVLERCGANLLVVTALYTAPLADSHNRRKYAEDPQSDPDSLLGGIRDNPVVLKHLARDMLTALSHLHKRGLAHMDISSDNVVLDGEFKPGMQIFNEVVSPKDKGIFGWFDAWRTRWQMLQAVNLRRAGRHAEADALQRELDQKLEVAIPKLMASAYHEGSLAKATFKLTDFGRAVPFKGLLPGLPEGAAEAAGKEARDLLQQPPQRYNRDGVVVFSDPTYRPPEEILGMKYIGPSYDMWKLGCLLYEAATDKKLFSQGEIDMLRRMLKQEGRKNGLTRVPSFSDEHYLLDLMVTLLGNVPRELCRKSPLHEEFFLGKDSPSMPDMLRIYGIKTLKATPEEKPLRDRLVKMTVLPEEEARAFADFLTPMLQWEPASRATADQMLQHPWLKEEADTAKREAQGKQGAAQ